MVTKSEALYLELANRKQSTSLEWFEHSVGRITALTAYQLLHTNIDQPSSSLIKQICSTELSKVITAPLECVYSYSAKQAIMHTQISCTPAGLVVNPEYPYLGASPDG